MATGPQTAYKLDLEDIIAFPDTVHVPVLPPEPGESWIIFGEIFRDVSVFRPVYMVRDKINCDFPVAFYMENPTEAAKACKIGHILCITSGMRHYFADGSNGYRIGPLNIPLEARSGRGQNFGILDLKPRSGTDKNGPRGQQAQVRVRTKITKFGGLGGPETLFWTQILTEMLPPCEDSPKTR
ncbi:hypothetical protein DFH07DRAFT_756166 [Mycena maculata]|uniref:Uncharacterized protein n=1 Tax=Mycena maculata TaxID=230809 RepID=A0AAD7MS32_9AGAR|nr:hypothetical protein DFH07DRAFT_756166 [Mycena maculata]